MLSHAISYQGTLNGWDGSSCETASSFNGWDGSRLLGCLMLCMQTWIMYEYVIVAHGVAIHNSNISNIL
jgi:hypothetical protein